MSRTALIWTGFAAALALGFAVMVFFTIRMLELERSVASAQAHAALEETVRLALWRMDSAAAVLLAEGSDSKALARNTAPIQNTASAHRFEPASQMAISQSEFEQRQAIRPVAAEGWREIEPELLDRVRDILPGAGLEAVAAGEDPNKDSRRLATIPARLVVPASALPDEGLPLITPLRLSLVVAWACAVVAAVAGALLLGGTLSLSERRGAFASAVTHELRTPLTTFRMYAEMLATGVVNDPAARETYLRTLVSESDRLSHLIENVLAYSRLEKRLGMDRAESLSVARLIEQALPALRRRAEQAGLALEVRVAEDGPAAVCRTDPVAVQQILANLVDNACKYGGTSIELSSRLAADRVEFAVSDGGPGLGAKSATAFRAFNKARNDPVPGIGLGLYLSRRLARGLGGDLEHRPGSAGTVMVLTLPRS